MTNEEQVMRLKRICKWSILQPQVYQGDYSLDQNGREAAAILEAVHNVGVAVDPDSGSVTFDG